jgi:hypothetical protein
MYIDTWARLQCPECSEYSFVDQGDMQDLTQFDTEGCICWNCQTGFDFEGNIIDNESSDIYCDEGVHLIRLGEICEN